MKRPASDRWARESNVVFDEEVAFQQRFSDPETGIQPLRLTTLPYINTHIYPEVPVSTPDGKRFFFCRLNPFSGERNYWIADIETHAIRQITDEPDAAAPIVTPDGQWFYYSVGRTIMRMSPETFEREVHCTIPEEMGKPAALHTMSDCGERILCGIRRGSQPVVASIDLKAKTTRIVFEHVCAVNPHVQYSRNHDHWVMVQVNDGFQAAAAGHDPNPLKRRTPLPSASGQLARLTGECGASLHVMKDDGSGHTILNVGRTTLEHVQGHQCWLGRDNTAIVTTHRRESPDDAWRQNRIIAVSPGDEQYQIICEGRDEGFTHVHTTRDGRYWVADCNRTARIYVGSTSSGRYKLFTNTGATFGAHQTTHPHPFFLGDDVSIGWNSDVTGVSHVYVARIPDGFLEDLDQCHGQSKGRVRQVRADAPSPGASSNHVR